MAENDEPFRAPVQLGSLRTICDDPDDGRRNWFVTLAYWDLSRQTAAYTHAIDRPKWPAKIKSLDAYAGAVEHRPTELFQAFQSLSDAIGRSVSPLRPVDAEPPPQPTTSSERDPSWGWPTTVLAEQTGLPLESSSTTSAGGRPRPLNANFCTFATWSSLTLGRDIRNVRLPRRFESLSNQHLRRTVTNFVVAARRLHGMELARLLGRGQRVVLWEVGYGLHALFAGEPVLNRLSAVDQLDFTTYGRERNFTDNAMNELVTHISQWLAMSVVPRGATGLRQLRTKDLAQGLASYHLARRAAQQAREASDQELSRRLWKWVAELILRGNILIGAYEQRKVDQLLEYPIEDFASDFFLERSGLETRERTGEGRWRRRLDRSVRGRLERHGPQIWSRFFTDQILVFWAGDEILRLGRDLPLPPRATEFHPDDLAVLDDQWLRMLWRRYDHSYGEGHGTQSRIWSIFSDRMNYIVNFMRSRAQTPGLWRAPFEPWEDRLLRCGVTPRSQDDPAS
jgi:hypothetical protein